MHLDIAWKTPAAVGNSFTRTLLPKCIRYVSTISHNVHIELQFLPYKLPTASGQLDIYNPSLVTNSTDHVIM